MAVDPNIKKKADDIRNKVYGKEVRESLASGLEAMSSDVVENTGRQDNVESQFQDVIENTTDKDVISAPEIIAARNGEANLKARLDKEKNEVTAQLDQIVTDVTSFGAVADADYYDEATQKYYSDEAMTIPATDNTYAFQIAVNYLHENGGGTLFAPKGNYAFRSGVKWLTKVSLVGTGMGNTVFLAEGEIFDLFYQISYNSSGFDYDKPEAWLEDLVFENFECDLKAFRYSHANVNGKALFMLYMRRARFKNLFLRNTIGTALGCDFLTETIIDGVIVENAGRNWGVPHPTIGNLTVGQSGIGIGTGALEEETVVVTNCHIFNSGNYGIFVEAQVNGGVSSKFAKISNCHVEGNRIGIGNKGSGALIIDSCSVFKNETDGIRLDEIKKGDIITGCDIDSNGASGINLANQFKGETIISANRIHHNKRHGVEFGTDDIQGGYMENVSVSNNEIYQNGFTGIFINWKHKGIRIKSNTIFNNGQLGTNQYSTRGIYLAYAQDVDITGNTLFDSQPTKTQVYDISIADNLGLNYTLNSNNIKTIEFQGFGSFDRGTIGFNVGLETRKRGTATFKAGDTITYVNHNFQSTFNTSVKNVSITPQSNDNIWVSALEGNRIKVSRNNTTDSASFLYDIQV